MDCQDIFLTTDRSSDEQRCRLIAEAAPTCTCEGQSVSPHSPGPVANDERLVRLIFSPIHIDSATGEINEAAFSDVQDKGLSVHRLAHAALSDIEHLGHNKVRDDHARGKTDRVFLGTAHATAGQVRTLIDETGDRQFCIYDTALAEAPAHADVCQTPAPRSQMKRARKRLRDLFSRRPVSLGTPC